MVEAKRKELSVRAERALLLGASFFRGDGGGKESFQELAKLAETAGAKVIQRVLQKRERIDPT
ncbi:MAG TPA: GTPase HflX, partial [Candidatus Hypogeohydataceae bacterium YC38]